MKPSLVVLPGQEYLGEALLELLDMDRVTTTIKEFPDGECYVRIHTSVNQQIVFIAGSLNRPSAKILTLLFLAAKLKELGSRKIVLIAPYLPYMRQDKEFHAGESITSIYFARLLSTYFDHLITLDPHLHRHRSLKDLYQISSDCLHSAPLLADWVRTHVEKPVILGPDSESKQWVKEIAKLANAPYTVLLKQRLADDQVTLTGTDLSDFPDFVPILVDDIISTAGTMTAAVGYLNKRMTKPPICLGIHAVFSNNAYSCLLSKGVSKVITTNSIPHESNGIDISSLLASAIQRYMLGSISKQ